MKLAARIWFLSLTLMIPFTLVAFVRWELDPGEWPMGARYIAAWLVLVAVVIHAATPRVTK